MGGGRGSGGLGDKKACRESEGKRWDVKNKGEPRAFVCLHVGMRANVCMCVRVYVHARARVRVRA